MRRRTSLSLGHSRAVRQRHTRCGAVEAHSPAARTHRGETGRVSLFVAVVATAIIAVLGLVVDGTGILEARSQANQIARQAARMAGQQIDRSTVSDWSRPTRVLRLDPVAAQRAGMAALQAAGCTPDSSIRLLPFDVQAICVLTYTPRLLPFLPTVEVEGRATARAIRVH